MSVGISIGIGEDKDEKAAVLLTILGNRGPIMTVTMSSSRARLYGQMLLDAGSALDEDEA